MQLENVLDPEKLALLVLVSLHALEVSETILMSDFVRRFNRETDLVWRLALYPTCICCCLYTCRA